MHPVSTAAASLLLLQCTPSAAQYASAKMTPLRIVAFGTSLTARGGWTGALEAALSRCLERPVAVSTVALSGATSNWAVSVVDRVISQSPTVVLIEVSVNNASLHRFVSVDRSQQNLARIVDRLRERLPRLRIIEMAMNPVRGIRGLIRPFLDRYIDGHRDLAWEEGIEFVDHRRAWRRLSEKRLATAIPDGAHPMPEAAAAVIVPALVARIAAGNCRNETAAAAETRHHSR